MTQLFRDHVVLLTGASSGIGAAVARELIRQGARVALAARRTELLDSLVKELGADRALAVTCDVTKDGDPEAAVARVVAAWGRLDAVIANAGFAVAGRFERLTVEDHRRQMETNLFGVIRTLRASIAELRKTKGRIGIVGSVNGYIGTPATSSYVMSKFAVRGLAQALSYELAGDGISVTHIAPGFVESEIRFKDNQGVHDPATKDPVPSWLVASAASAAREIVSALYRRKHEQVVTFHGKVFVFLERHAPWFVRLLAGQVDGEKRKAGETTVAPG
ncbi:MAG: SDR family NAD(P)-dependent oxidoreductase [Thermoanaerobaculia bacterium]